MNLLLLTYTRFVESHVKIYFLSKTLKGCIPLLVWYLFAFDLAQAEWKSCSMQRKT